MKSLHSLLAPLSVESEDLIFDPIYDQIRHARREDDETLSQGVWLKNSKRAQWKEVEALCCEILEHRSKDIQIAVWLWESWVHLYQWEGFFQGCELILQLYKAFDLHPRDSLHKKNILEWIDQTLSLYLKEIRSDIQNDVAESASDHLRDLRQLTGVTFSSLDNVFTIAPETGLKDTETKPNILSSDPENNLPPPEMTSDIAFDAVEQVSSFLKSINPQSISPHLLDLALLWKDKTILQIIEDTQESQNPIHKLFFLLYGK